MSAPQDDLKNNGSKTEIEKSDIKDEENEYPQITARIRQSDSLDSEFRYYSKLLPDLILLLTDQQDRKKILPWIHKLSSPGYNVTKLRDKRNRFMLMLCMSLILNDISGPFILPPPQLVLPDLDGISKPDMMPFEWELDTMWEDQLLTMKQIEINGEGCKEAIQHCYKHKKSCPKESCLNKSLGQLLDRQFRYLLYICKPYAALLMRSSDRIRAARWIQTLCCIDTTYCAISKGIRNDYMMVLSGYLVNQCLIGPFQDYPMERLLPLSEITYLKRNEHCTIDPTNAKTLEFFNDIPVPQEGAFAFIAVTGELAKAKF